MTELPEEYGRRASDKSTNELIVELYEHIAQMQKETDERVRLLHEHISATEARLYEKISLHHNSSLHEIERIQAAEPVCPFITTPDTPTHSKRLMWSIIGLLVSSLIIFGVTEVDRYLKDQKLIDRVEEHLLKYPSESGPPVDLVPPLQ